MNEAIALSPEAVWKIAFSDEGHWRAGIYHPDAGSPEGISILEKHTCPELFICLQGRAGLLIRRDGLEKAVVLEPNQAIIVEDYHCGFKTDSNGFFFVVIRPTTCSFLYSFFRTRHAT